MTPVLAQAYAARAAIDALILQLEIAEGVPAQSVTESGACPNCGAPEEKQAVAASMGGKTVMCSVCKNVRTL